MGFVQAGNLRIGEGIPKICIPVLGRTKEEMITEAKKARESDADFAELRIDWFDFAMDIDKSLELLTEVKKTLRGKPLLFTFRSAKEGGSKEITQGEYIDLNYKAIASGCVDLLDIELSLGDKPVEDLVKRAHQSGVKVIVSSHDFEKTPVKEELLKRFQRMDLLGADILKIAVFPHSKQDVLTLLMATQEAKEKYTQKPLITMSMGELGVISRLSGEFFGSSVTFGIVNNPSAPGQIEINTLKLFLNTLHIQKKKNLFFIGFMGAGKTTIAKAAAQQMNASLVEMDEEIEQKTGMAITEIFECYGETYFRDLESKLVLEITASDNHVISCGGGITLRHENVWNMKENGSIIYLKASPETIYERVKDFTTRPKLNGHMNVEYIHNLMQERCIGYEEAADIIVETDGKSAEQILTEIISVF